MAQLRMELSVFPDGATAWIGHVEMKPLDLDFEVKEPGEDAAMDELCRVLATELERLAQELRNRAGEIRQ